MPQWVKHCCVSNKFPVTHLLQLELFAQLISALSFPRCSTLPLIKQINLALKPGTHSTHTISLCSKIRLWSHFLVSCVIAHAVHFQHKNQALNPLFSCLVLSSLITHATRSTTSHPLIRHQPSARFFVTGVFRHQPVTRSKGTWRPT